MTVLSDSSVLIQAGGGASITGNAVYFVRLVVVCYSWLYVKVIKGRRNQRRGGEKIEETER